MNVLGAAKASKTTVQSQQTHGHVWKSRSLITCQHGLTLWQLFSVVAVHVLHGFSSYNPIEISFNAETEHAKFRSAALTEQDNPT